MASAASPGAASASPPPAARKSSGGRRSSGGSAPLPEGSFLTRQAKHAEAHEKRTAALASAVASEQTPFKPLERPAAEADSALLAASPRHASRAGEDADARVRRLSVTEAQQHSARLAALAEAEAARSSYAPELTPATRALVAKGAAAPARREAARAKAAQRLAAEMALVAPFRPDTSESRKSRKASLCTEQSAVSRVSAADAEQLSARIRALQEEKAAHLEALRHARLQEEAKVCTFRPQRLVPAVPARSDAPAAAVVKGMEAFAARQAEARKRRAEAEAAAAAEEAALFVPTAVPREVFEQWKPFKLADPAVIRSRQESIKRMETELEAQRMKECTFAPSLALTQGSARPKTPGSRAATPATTPAKAPKADE